MRDCTNCDHYFCPPTRRSPCGQCLSRAGRTGWRPMGWRTRLLRWLRRRG